tara:strand:- start:508 stop:1038 length:531 start_codon:yes stop_codon:yes gene_type:complete
MYSIISNNCYGTNYYKINNIEYNTPFIGLYIYAECYINLLEKFDNYINLELIEIKKSKYGIFNYPIGLLGNSEIHFIHYNNFNEAKIKWDRRKKRLKSFQNCIIKLCDRDLFTINILNRFIKLNHPCKILFLSINYNIINNKNLIIINISSKQLNFEGDCPDGYELEKLYPIHTLL